MNDIIPATALKEARRKAESLFFCTEYSPEKIATLAGCDVSHVRLWIFGSKDHTTDPECWFHKKEIQCIDAVHISKYREVEPVLIAHTKARALTMLTKQVEKKAKKLDQDQEELAIDEIKKLSDVYSSIDKIDRLEQGRATNITESKLDRMDATEVVAERRKRSDYIDADFREINNE